MNNILVTGGAGFIGSNFIRALLAGDSSVRVINLDALTYSSSIENLRNLPDETRHIFINGNICFSKLVSRVFNEYSVDTVVHFAAETHVDRSITGPAAFIETNILGTFTLLEVARKYWIENGGLGSGKFRFHHVSTDEVYGSLLPGEAAWTEAASYSPNSPYAASKAASDHLVRSYGHTYGFPYSITNCSNNYGPHQFPEKFIPLVILNALNNQPIPVYGDGFQVRDWLHVRDHCEAILTVLKNGGIGESYNLGGGNQPTNIEMVHSICDLLDELIPGRTSKRELISFVKDRPGHDRRYAMDSTKILHELGWQPVESLQSGLRATVEWYLNNLAWVDAIRKQASYQAWMESNYGKR